ncbi:hypothetical protein [Streptomyces sp. NBC_01803]|uniref:hypothetical protein n=1 Tax=Streptomyces sp. NBC_01803 TaxID=2975946 RepID=UPI002DDC00CA|nr:hypothetical protein [Streptomyces sp. NBC_01803]WSA44492.1 hypothetical protein OIE51_09910 [Streptomyces sp. NBC_01803]
MMTLALLSDEALARAGDPHPELCVRLVVAGISHDPSGRTPPSRLELRMSPGQLRDLMAQGRAAQAAQIAQARARAGRAQAAEVATDGTRTTSRPSQPSTAPSPFPA